MKHRVYLMCGALMWGASAPAAASPLPATGTFVYDAACVAPGDEMIEFHVLLVRSAAGLKAQIDFNDGGQPGRAQAKDLKFEAASGAISFTFSGDLPHTFQGKVTKEALTGSFDAAPPLTLAAPAKAKTQYVLETLHACAAK